MTSEYLAHKWLTELLQAPLWLGLTGEDGQEIQGEGYARVQVNGKFNPPANRSVINSQQIAFTKADGDWPTVTGVTTFDAPQGGNELLPGAIVEPKEISAGVRAVFDPGDIELGVA